MDTGVVAIVVPAAVAIAALGFSWDQKRRELAHSRELSDLIPVREVFDQAAVLLHRIAYDLDDLRSYLIQHGGVRFFKTDRGTAVYEVLGEHGKDADVLYERLSVRLGRKHPVAVQFKAANEAVLSIWRSASLLRDEPESDGHPSAAQQIAALNEEKRTQIEAERVSFDSAREGFVTTAQRTAGAKLRSA